MQKTLTVEQSYRTFLRDYPDVLTIRQLGEILGVCEKTVLKLVRENKIQSIRMGRQYRIPKLFLLKYLGMMDDFVVNEKG